MKKLLILALAVIAAAVVVALPSLVRWLYYYEGAYRPDEIARPKLADIQAPTPEMPEFVDRGVVPQEGTVLVDRAHGNRFQMAELSVLQARLAARGQRLEAVTNAEALPGQLRSAQALVVISPGKDWTAAEVQRVREFVDKGGRLLLISDPSRYDYLYDELGFPYAYDYDLAHIADLAGLFGVVFQSDYLYNTVDNENNFRNVRLSDLAADELTRGLEQVVFYAARSIRAPGVALIRTGGDTRSSASERAEDLAVAALTADGKVLALGDLTFLIEPYNAVADNDRFIANIASFLAGSQRQYALADFPYFFDKQVDLVYAGDPVLDSDLLPAAGSLQALLAGKGIELTLRGAEDRANDTLFMGLYSSADEVEPYLEAAQVTLWLSPTQDVEAAAGATEEVTRTAEVTATAEITLTAPISPTQGNRLQIESLGEMVLTGTALLVLEDGADRQVLVALSDTLKGLKSALERLSSGDLANCTLRETETPTRTLLALCPTGEVEAGKGGGGWKKEEPPPPKASPGVTTTQSVTSTQAPPAPAASPKGSVLVLSLDSGQGKYDSLTGVDDFVAILKADYKVTAWSKKATGLPSLEECLAHDLVIFATGDFEEAFGEEESNLLLSIMLDGNPILLSGGYINADTSRSTQVDIQVKDAAHPLARGFGAGEVIDFVPPPSGSVYSLSVLETPGEGEAIPFTRGPRSEDAGAPALVALEEAAGDVRVLFMGFPVYLLPEQAKARLVLNCVDWLLASRPAGG